VKAVDSQAAGFGAANAIDGNPNTFWATQWEGAPPPHPHEIQIDLGAVRDVTGFRYLPRQDEFDSGNISRYEFYVSADGTNWGVATATGTFSPGKSEQEVSFPLKSGRYVKLRSLTEVNLSPWAVVAELSVLQKQCGAPSVILSQPRSGYIQNSSTLQLVADACVSAGQGVRFVVDGVPVGTDFDAPYSVNATGLSAAEHVVEAYLVDGSGNAVNSPGTYDRSTQVGRGDTYVAIGDGITYGLGDDRGIDDNSADGRNLLGGFESVLADELRAKRGYPVAVVNQGVIGGSAFSGAASINQVLQNYPEAGYFMLMFGHNDFSAGRPSGLGLHPGNPGYTGSFKDYMQRMITAIRAVGKVPLISKHTPVNPFDGEVDLAMREYNLVIDELTADGNNGITVPSPDIYNFFFVNESAAPGAFYSTPTEPSGLGYRAIADLWRKAIAP
jgi:lysophospholipase L1-like esterase